MLDDYVEECLRLYKKYSIVDPSCADAKEYEEKIRSGQLVDIPFVEMAVTTVCNLRCKGCSNLIPEQSRKEHFDLDECIANLNRLLQHVNRIYRLKVHGGEPLLYPYLGDFLQYALEKDKIVNVRISTNGTVIPNPDTLAVMKHPKFVLHISGYPFVRSRADELIDILKKENIAYYYMSDQTWSDLGNPYIKRERSTEETISMIRKCNMRKCTAYFRGKIYPCSFASGRAEITGDLTDAMEIRSGTDLYDFYAKQHFMSCDFCDGVLEGRNCIAAGEQIAGKDKYE